MQIREVTGGTYCDALDVTTVFCVAFRNDPGFWFYQQPKYRFNGDIFSQAVGIKHPAERLDELVRRAKNFRDLVRQQAYSFYPLIISPGTRTFVGYDDADGAPIAIAMWVAPKDHTPALTWKQKIGLFFKVTWARAHQLWYQATHWGRSPGHVTGSRDLFRKAMEELGVIHSEKREKEIENAESGAPLTRKYATELLLFGTARQGKGVGKEFFDKVFSKIEPEIRAPIVFGRQRPPQALIIASDPGQRLYSKFGFKKVKGWKHQVSDDACVSLSLMVRNWDPEESTDGNFSTSEASTESGAADAKDSSHSELKPATTESSKESSWESIHKA